MADAKGANAPVRRNCRQRLEDERSFGQLRMRDD
jgi:hypothetical protein